MGLGTWKSWGRLSGAALLLCLPVGCGLARPHLDKALMAEGGKSGRSEGVQDCYLVACPDVLEIQVEGRPELDGRLTIDPEGAIDLGEPGRIRVEGQTAPECGRRIAIVAGVAPSHVSVRVAGYRSQQVYLFGQGIGRQRSVPYQGPETVLDLLQRCGGITAGAAPNDVYIVRPHLTEGRQPEVYTVNLPDILKKHDAKTNLRVQPFDQVYIGETRQSTIVKLTPPCLRPIFEMFCGLYRKDEPKPWAGADNPTSLADARPPKQSPAERAAGFIPAVEARRTAGINPAAR